MTHDKTEISRLAQPRRRFLLALSSVGAAFALPTHADAATSPETSPSDQMRHHAAALLALIRKEFPENATAVRIHLLWEADANTAPFVTAEASSREWEADSRLRGGGLLVDRTIGRWHLVDGSPGNV